MTSTAHAPAPGAAQRRAAVIGGAFGFFVDRPETKDVDFETAAQPDRLAKAA
jgi:hypothetical protein